MNETYEHFLKNDVSLETFLALDYAKIINNKFTKLQNEAVDSESVDKLVEFVKHVPSCFLYESVFAMKYYNVGNYEKAIYWAFQAMEVLPKWDLFSAVNVFNTLSFSFYYNKNYEEAQKWGETGLKYNPFYPYLIGTLCVTYFALGKYEKAESFYKWLKENGFSNYTWGDYKSNPAFNDAAPYTPDIRAMVKISDEDLFKVIVSQRYFVNRTESLKKTNLTLALIAAGRYETAFWFVVIFRNLAIMTCRISIYCVHLKFLSQKTGWRRLLQIKEWAVCERTREWRRL